MRSKLPKLLSVLTAVLLLGGCARIGATTLTSVTANTAAAARTVEPPAPPAGWTTVLSSTFAGKAGSAPSTADWFYDIGTDWGSNNVEHDTNSTQNVYLDGDGHLVIKATDTGGRWQSGRLESTRDDFEAPPGGEMEITGLIEQPSGGEGYWPAFWTLGSGIRAGDGAWPSDGEIDMLEDINGDDESAPTFHYGSGSLGTDLAPCPGSSCDSGFHTYSVIINRTNNNDQTLQFLVDNQVLDTITESRVGTSEWEQAVDHGLYIILDVAIGGAYPNLMCKCTTPNNSTKPNGELKVGYIAVYEKGGNTTPTAKPTQTGNFTGPAGACLTNQNGLDTEGNPIVVQACDKDAKDAVGAGQQWSLYSDQTVRSEGGCLQITSPVEDGASVDWYPCDGTSGEDWQFASGGELENPGSGLCLTDPYGDTGADLEVETCGDASYQTWTEQ